MAESSLPVLVLTVLGTVITALGFLAAGNVMWVIVGLTAVATAGVLHVLDRRP